MQFDRRFGIAVNSSVQHDKSPSLTPHGNNFKHTITAITWGGSGLSLARWHWRHTTATNSSSNINNNKQTHKQANNDVTNYTQTLPEDTTSTVPSLADKHKTAPSYISQDEKTRDFEQSTKSAFPHYTVCVNQLSQTTIIQQVDTATVKSAWQVNAWQWRNAQQVNIT
jgi:hypothetical protein